MKKYISYIVLILVGTVLGWLLFRTNTAKTKQEVHADSHEAEHLWTCSMHPQILKHEPGNCPICGMELIPADHNAEGTSTNQFSLTENAMALANIQTTIVGNTGQPSSQLKFSGTIKVDEENNKVQVSYFSGRIEKLNVNYTGQAVKIGQLLATIYSPELITAQQELITASSLKNAQPEIYQAVVNKLKLWKLTDEQIRSIESTGKTRTYFPIYATVSGTVTDKMVNEGDQVKQGQPLFKISNLNSVWATFDVYEKDITGVSNNAAITITANAYPGKEFKTNISFVNPVLNTGTRTVQMRAELPNAGEIWKPGMFVEGKLESTRTTNTNEAISIPSSSVLWTGKRSIVYIKVKTEEPVFEMKEIVLGAKYEDSYEVLEGLKPGDEIVTNGTFTVDAAAQLQGKPSMMNRPTKADENKQAASPEEHKRILVSEQFTTQLKVVYEDYLILKNNLVKDQFKEARKSTANFITELSKVDMSLLKKPESHKIWMSAKQIMSEVSKNIIDAKEIGEQRQAFIKISEQMIILAETFGVHQKTYLQYCPMANSNKGTFWLSEQDTIENPYFGASMLTCGNTIKIIE